MVDIHGAFALSPTREKLHELFAAKLMHGFRELFVLRNHPPLPGNAAGVVVHSRWVHRLLFKHEQRRSAARALLIVSDVTVTNNLIFSIELSMPRDHDAVLHRHRPDGERCPYLRKRRRGVSHKCSLYTGLNQARAPCI